jgi:dipeptidyl aminopeptidase/acylaminoacyl peptidase
LSATPDHFGVEMSDAGDKISYFARKGSDIELRIENSSGKLLRTFSIGEAKGNRIGSYAWALTGKHILIEQNNNGDENDHVICFDVTTGKTKDLTPFGSAKSDVVIMSKKHPDEVIVVSNKRDRKWMDAYKINIVTGKVELIYKNDRYSSLLFDNDFKLRAASLTLSNGDHEIYWAKDGKMLLFKRYSYEDSANCGLLHFSADNRTVYSLEAVNRDKSALFAYETRDIDSFVSSPRKRKNLKLSKVLFQSNLADIDSVYSDPKTFAPQVAVVDYLKPEISILDKAVEKDIQYLKQQRKEMILHISERNAADDTWLVCYTSAKSPTEYHMYRREPKTGSPISLKFLFYSRTDLMKYRLQDKEPIVIKSRDGLDLVCYLTKSADFQTSFKKKMVVLVHGGPWCRDHYGFESDVQLFANRGYSVLQVNYRGSTGFGKKFVNAINGHLQDVRRDIVDGVNWAIKNGIADKDSVAIVGGSFGGYSVLAGLTSTPDVFCCGVDYVGISNWNTFLETVPQYWHPFMICFYKLFGLNSAKKGAKVISDCSPIYSVNNIKKPLIVFQGQHDPRVNKAESEQIVNALKKRNLPVAYVLYPDEGHGFQREPNYKSCTAFTELFLAKILGGKSEPIHHGEFKDSSYKILEGKELLVSK